MIMSYNTRQEKTDLLIRAFLRGEEVTKETAPIILGIKTPRAIKAYMDEFNEWNADQNEPREEATSETSSVTPEPKKKTFTPKTNKMDLTKFLVKIEDENGQELEDDFEVVTSTSNAIIIRKIVPINKSVTINGEQVIVDLRALRIMSPDATFKGIKVSTLIVAAELA